jgi:eukaryotic-like serine/threonine-protein kinase
MPGEEASLVGRTLAGKFEILERIGRGSMAVLYKARQRGLGKTVAIKVMLPELASDPMFSARFLREAKAAARLDHPSSVRVLDFGQEPDGLFYIAMEYVDGRDLARVLAEDGELSADRIERIVSQVLDALAVAHDLGVVHRDLKPENILVVRGGGDDVVKVCDFGMAKLVEPLAKPTGKAGYTVPMEMTRGLVVGTPEYMSPEQGKGGELDRRSDVYSVGVLLYRLLAGRVPFEGETPLSIVLRHVTEEPTPPSRLKRGVSPRLEAVCLRALQKERGARFQTAAEMREALQGKPRRKGARRAPGTVVAPLLAALAIALGIGLGWLALRRPTPEAPKGRVRPTLSAASTAPPATE